VLCFGISLTYSEGREVPRIASSRDPVAAAFCLEVGYFRMAVSRGTTRDELAGVLYA
jgi:hypothetical protein